MAALRFLTVRPPELRSAEPVSILKPLAGLDADLEANLRTFFEQDYPAFEILFAVREADDGDPERGELTALGDGSRLRLRREQLSARRRVAPRGDRCAFGGGQRGPQLRLRRDGDAWLLRRRRHDDPAVASEKGPRARRRVGHGDGWDELRGQAVLVFDTGRRIVVEEQVYVFLSVRAAVGLPQMKYRRPQG